MNTLKIQRNLLHIGFGICYVITFLVILEKETFYTIHTLIAAATMFAMMWMISSKHIFIGKMARDTDALPGVGGMMYMIGLSIVLCIEAYLSIPKYIIIAGIMTLVIGDPIASIVGKISYPFGKIEVFQKSLFASMIAWVTTCFTITMICFISKIPITNGNILMIIVGAGLVFEFLIGHKIVRKKSHAWCIDNALIPVVVIMTGILII